MGSCLQYRRVVAQLAGFSDRLVDQRVERDYPLDELAPQSLRVWQFRPCLIQHSGKSAGDLRRQGGEGRGQPPPGAAEISPRQNDAGGHDADRNLGGARDRQHEDVGVRSTGRAKRVGADDHRGITGERCRVGGEVAKLRGG